jgi:hypothetical protein
VHVLDSAVLFRLALELAGRDLEAAWDVLAGPRRVLSAGWQPLHGVGGVQVEGERLIPAVAGDPDPAQEPLETEDEEAGRSGAEHAAQETAQ